MFIRFALVILTMNILNPVHAIQFSYDDMGRSASSQFNNSANDKTVFYVHDNSSNVISVSNNIDLYLFFEPVQNYSDTVITFGVENYKSDFIYDLYISKDLSPLLYKSFEHSGSVSLDLSSNVSPLFIQVVARNKYGQKFTSSIKKLVPLDSDEDHLPDHLELSICSDPNNVDSDGDGLSDGIEMGAETGRYLSDPCNSDTDGDGIDDAYEYAQGWDIQHFDITALNEQGLNHWNEYAQAQAGLAQEKGESVVSGEHLLDVTDKKAFGYTGLVPSGERSMTIMYWVNFNTLSSRYQLSGVHDENNHRLYAGLDYGRPIAGVGNSTATGPDEVEVNQWVHLAAVFDKEARQRVLYLNGRELKRDSYVSFKGASLRSLLFGAAHRLEGASDFQDAKLDDIQVWSRALDSSDVQSYMLTPPQAGEAELLAYYDFSRYRGLWVENVATGEFDMKLSELNIIKTKTNE